MMELMSSAGLAGPTALVLVLIVGVWAVIAGLVEFSAAFRSGEPAGTRAMLIPGGLVTIAFGVVLVSRRMPAAAYASSRRTPRPRRGLHSITACSLRLSLRCKV